MMCKLNRLKLEHSRHCCPTLTWTLCSTKNGCSSMSGGYELVSLSGEYAKHLSSVVLNNYNLLFGLSPTPFKFPLLFYYIHQLNCLYLFISKICDICNSNTECKCTCSCNSKCTGNTICLCLCNDAKDVTNGYCICICKHKNCKCVCICICNKNGEQCCCVSGKGHSCNGCLTKIEIGTLGFQPSDVIDQLFYIQCSLQSLRTKIRVDGINKKNQVVSMYSLSNVMDYKVVINRLLESSKKIDQILLLTINIYECKCISRLEWRNSNTIDLRSINVKKIVENIASENNQNDLKLDDIRKIHELGMGANHVCLCMVFKYILYPAIIKMCYGFFGMDFDAMSTISRKFHKYQNSRAVGSEVINVLPFVIDILDSISMWIRNNYPYAMVAYLIRVEIKCFCMYSHDPGYYSVISIILVLSSVVENIWTMDIETIGITINFLSNLFSEYQFTYNYTNYGSNSVSYSQDLKLKYKKFTINLSGYLKSLKCLIDKLNKDTLNRYYQIISELSFQLDVDGTGTKLSVNRGIKMYVSNWYMGMLKQMCSNDRSKRDESCKCGVMKIYTFSILLSSLYNKLMSKMNINEEILYIIDLLKKNKFDEFIKMIKRIENNVIYNKTRMALVKNSSIIHGTNVSSKDTSLTDVMSVRNWGYDAHYQHQVTIIITKVSP